MKRKELEERLTAARLVPMVAHLPSFGLVLADGEAGPVCRHCKGKGAPIVDGEHLGLDWCLKQAESEGRYRKRGAGTCVICQKTTRIVLDGEGWCDDCQMYQ